MGSASLLVIEAAYLFSQSPLLYFKNGMWVNVKVIPNYPSYFFGQMKPGGWWYYFLAAFALKATVPTLLLIVAALVDLRSGVIDRWGEIILTSSIVFYVIINSIGAHQIGVRYLLPIFPLVFVWTSRIIRRITPTRIGIGAIAVLLVWQAWAAVHAFPNYIPYFNELAGGAAHGPSFLDDSNVDWGQGVKLAAEYVRVHRLQNVNMYTFSPWDNPSYYGLPANIPPSDAFERFVVQYPKPGFYIISAHYVARLKTVSPVWKKSKPVDRIGESLWVYAF
jgi:hypothetical protein